MVSENANQRVQNILRRSEDEEADATTLQSTLRDSLGTTGFLDIQRENEIEDEIENENEKRETPVDACKDILSIIFRILFVIFATTLLLVFFFEMKKLSSGDRSTIDKMHFLIDQAKVLCDSYWFTTESYNNHQVVQDYNEPRTWTRITHFSSDETNLYHQIEETLIIDIQNSKDGHGICIGSNHDCSDDDIRGSSVLSGERSHLRDTKFSSIVSGELNVIESSEYTVILSGTNNRVKGAQNVVIMNSNNKNIDTSIEPLKKDYIDNTVYVESLQIEGGLRITETVVILHDEEEENTSYFVKPDDYLLLIDPFRSQGERHVDNLLLLNLPKSNELKHSQQLIFRLISDDTTKERGNPSKGLPPRYSCANNQIEGEEQFPIDEPNTVISCPREFNENSKVIEDIIHETMLQTKQRITKQLSSNIDNEAPETTFHAFVDEENGIFISCMDIPRQFHDQIIFRETTPYTRETSVNFQENDYTITIVIPIFVQGLRLSQSNLQTVHLTWSTYANQWILI